MRPYPTQSRRGSLAPLLLATLLTGCASTGEPSANELAAAETAPAPSPGEPVATVIDARPAALVNGKGILWGDLKETLGDAAGAEALREVILDLRLDEQMEEAGVTIGERDIANEREMLLDELSPSRATALRLVDELRDRQRLGRRRFDALLHRSAALRALVADDIQVTTEEVQQRYEILYGRRRQVRLLTVPDLNSAHRAIERVRGGEMFGDVSVQISTDTSASRGGLLEPISAVDPSYPASLRQSVFALDAPGDVSDPVLLPTGYAVVQLVEVIESDAPPFDTVQASLQERVRLTKQRREMDRLARMLVTSTSLTIFDDALNESWERYKRTVRRGAAVGVTPVP